MMKPSEESQTTMPMRILLATSELNPYSKSGGLADMVAALAKSLGRAGHQVGVVTPLYRGVREAHPDLSRIGYRLSLPLGPDIVEAGVWTAEPHPGLTIYFIDQPEFYDRASLYHEHGSDYPDNARRFIYFSECVAHLARHLPWHPEIVHLHDWQTGLVPLLVRHQQLAEGWGTAPRTCLTIHNLAYQGVFPSEQFQWTNLPWETFMRNGVEFYGQMNCMKSGLWNADSLTTVSPRYAREITTPAFGCNLDGVLRERQSRLTGILNGVDYDEWTTRDNPHLGASYTEADMKGKVANKMALQKELGLAVRPEVPLFASITRLTE
jgi:starch synthase